jgi:hypothetical protein
MEVCMSRKNSMLLICLGLLMLAAPVRAQEKIDQADLGELGQELSNPVANLISLPLMSVTDFGVGPANSIRSTLNIQPVIPINLNKDWNLITRTILPLVYAQAASADRSDASGMGDILQSFLVSPINQVGGWIMGGGPILLYPTATDNALGGGKWAAGPTIIALKQQNGWTYGLYANHMWSYAGSNSRNDIDASFLQTFIAYQTPTFTSFAASTDSTYDWKSRQWIVPINLTASQMLMVDGRPISLRVGGVVYAEKPADGPDWGLRFAVTFIFPR